MFKKGQSGNPKGAPKKGLAMRDVFLKFMAAKEAGNLTRLEMVINKLKENALGGDTAACKWLAEQCIGKAVETVDANVKGDIKITINKIVDE